MVELVSQDALRLDERTRRVLYHRASELCTFSEIAAELGVSVGALRRFVAGSAAAQRLVEKGRGVAQRKLRGKLSEVAFNDEHKYQGPMLVYLSKQYLGMSERDPAPPEAIPGSEVTVGVTSFADVARRAAALASASVVAVPASVPLQSVDASRFQPGPNDSGGTTESSSEVES